MIKLGIDPETAYIGHSYTDMHARHCYITTHVFYEDLSLVKESMPKQDIYETLTSKGISDTITT